MIYSLTGKIIFAEPHSVAVDVNGIGYLVKTSGNTSAFCEKSRFNNEVITLLTEMIVSDNNISLFGFETKEELSAFKMLTSVSSIGGKTALAVLTELSSSEFALAVVSGDQKALTKAKGVGAKAAGRIILELKDKLAKEYGFSDSADFIPQKNTKIVKTAVLTGSMGEAVSALTVLGFSPQAAKDAISGADISLQSGELIKYALKNLSKN